MKKLANNDRAIRGCRPKPGQRRTFWTIESRKGLYVAVSIKAGAPLEDADRERDDFTRVYYHRDQRHGIFEKLDDVDRISLSEAWQAVQVRHAQTTLEGPRSTSRVTFGEVFTKWLDMAKAKPLKSWPAEEDMYHRHLKGHLESSLIAEMRKADFVIFRDKVLAVSTPMQADKALGLVARVLNWAEKHDHIEDHKAKNIPALSERVAGDRVLSTAELKALWKALCADPSSRPAIVLRILLLTGLRLSEVSEASRSEFANDTDHGRLWIIPAERMKGKEAHYVPVTQELAALLDDAERLAGKSQWLFPAIDRGKENGKPMSRYTPDYAYAKAAKALGFVDSEGKANTSVHDLRRTVATGLGRLGFSDDMIDRVQGRSKKRGSVTWIYNRHKYLAEHRDALERWQAELLRIVGG